MIKEAIAYITNLAVQAEKPEVLEINGRTYCTKNMTRYDKADMADPIKATTLTSLVDYIKQRRDELRNVSGSAMMVSFSTAVNLEP